MEKMTVISLENVCWSIKRALVGAIPPHLRAVQYNVDFAEQRVDCFFYYEGEASEDDIDAASSVMTEASGDFIESFGFIEHVESIDVSQPIPERGYWLFLRHEKLHSKTIKLLKIEADDISKSSVVIWLLEALLGKITPGLRAVKCDIDECKKVVYFWFYVDGVASEVELQLFEQAINETMQHFPVSYTKSGYITTWLNHKPIPDVGEYVYLRDESTLGEKEVSPPDFDRLLIQLSRALLGRVRPSLRAIKIDADDCSQTVSLWLYIDGKITKHDRETAETIEMWLSQWTDYSLEMRMTQLDYPQKIPHVGTYAYLRHEENAPWGNLGVGNLAPSA